MFILNQEQPPPTFVAQYATHRDKANSGKTDTYIHQLGRHPEPSQPDRQTLACVEVAEVQNSIRNKTTLERGNEVSRGQKRSPSLEEALHRGDETERADLEGDPQIRANTAEVSPRFRRLQPRTDRLEMSCDGNSATRNPTREMVWPRL